MTSLSESAPNSSAPRLVSAEIIASGRAVVLLWSDRQRTRFHSIWLRDNALDSQTRDPGNGQRLLTLAQIPDDTLITRIANEDDCVAMCFKPENKQVTYPAAWLRAHRYDRRGAPAAKLSAAGWVDKRVTTWDASSIRPRRSLMCRLIGWRRIMPPIAARQDRTKR